MTRHITLNNDMVAIVDDADFGWLSQWTWRTHRSGNTWYAIRTQRIGLRILGKKRTVYMHRAILDAASDTQVDHINHNGLDNQRHNLRACSASENMRNAQAHRDRQSTYKGVTREARTGRWVARIWVNDRNLNLKSWPTPEDAARAYDRAAQYYFGPFAEVNFPESRN